MKRVACLSSLAALLIAAPAAAHDFWLQLSPWRAPAKANVHVEFLVGHAGDVAPWSMRPERIVSIVSRGPGGVEDQREALSFPEGDRNGGAEIRLSKEGTHHIAMETTNTAYSDLPAPEFNAYLEKEGITHAIEARSRSGQEDERGRERYSRRAKALVQIGGKRTAEALAPVGQTLEIVPIDNPFSLRDDDPLRVEVRYRGAPLAGALVHFESLEFGLLPRIEKRTDSAGIVAFDFPKRGAWKLNTVWTEPITGDPRAEWETVFSSLTFGY